MPRNEIIPGLLDPAITTGMPTISVQSMGTIGTEAAGNVPVDKSGGVCDWADNLSWSREKHSFKMGGELMWIRPHTTSALNGRGSLGFPGVFTKLPTSRSTTGSGIADLLLGYASTVKTGTTLNSEERGWYYAGYFNDQWNVTQALTLNLGVRYEDFTPFIETHNREANFILDPGPLYGQFIVAGDPRLPRALMYGDHNNVAPRLGFAYRIPGIRDATIRGSFGVFYAQDQGNGVSRRRSGNPPFYGYGSISLASDQLHTSTGFLLSPSTTIPRPAPIDPSAFVLNPTSTTALTSWPTHMQTGYVEEWSLSLQKMLPWRMLFETNYVGNHGVHLLAYTQGNQPVVLNGTTVQYRGPLSTVTQASINAIGYWNATQYEGISAKLEKRLAQGVEFRNSLTYGHSFNIVGASLGGDLCSGCGASDSLQNSYDPAANWGPSDSDVRFRYVLSGLFDLPFGRGRQFFANQRAASAILGGWAVSPIYIWQTGLPVTVRDSADIANAGTTSRPNQVCDPNSGAPHTLQGWFNTSCFASQASYTFGNTRKGSVIAPGKNDLDLSLQRSFPVLGMEGANLNFRMDAFNALNHPQFNGPNATYGNTAFGTITSAGAQRELQAAVRLTL